MIFYFCFSSKCFKHMSMELTVGQGSSGVLCCGDTGYELKNSLPTFPHLDLILPLAHLSTPSTQTLEYLLASIPASIPCTSQSYIWSTCLLPSLPQFPAPFSLTSGVPACFHPCLNLLHFSVSHLEYLPAPIPDPVPCTSQRPISPDFGVPACFHPCPSSLYLSPPASGVPAFFHLSTIPYTYFSAPHQPSFGVPASFHPLEYLPVSTLAPIPCPNSLHLSAPHQPSTWSTCLLPSLPTSLHLLLCPTSAQAIWSTCLLPSLPNSLHLLLCPTSARPLEYVPACFHFFPLSLHFSAPRQASIWSTCLFPSLPHPCISQPSTWSTCLLPSLPNSLHLLLCPTSARPLEYLPASTSSHFPTLLCPTSAQHLEYLPASLLGPIPSSLSPAFGVPACFPPWPNPFISQPSTWSTRLLPSLA